jgi:hypothetical protein
VARVVQVAWAVDLPMALLDPQFQVIKICIRDILAERDRLHIHPAQVHPKRNQFRS